MAVGKTNSAVLSWICFLSVAACPPAAWAGEAVAMVLEAAGAIEPNPISYAMLDSGTVLRLGENARLKIAHLPLCDVILVKASGTLVIGRRSIDWIGDAARETVAGSCLNRAVYVDPDMVPAGVGLRTLNLPTLASRPIFVLNRVEPSILYEIEIRDLAEATDAVRLKLPRRVFAWPRGSPPLRQGGVYALTLIRDGTRSGRSLRFLVPLAATSDDALVPVLLSFH